MGRLRRPILIRAAVTLRQWWLGFWRGATRPSLIALLIAFSLNGFAFAALLVYVSPDFMAGPMHRYVMADAFDTHLRVTSKALAIRPSELPDVVILGASLTKRCIESEDSLTDMVAKKSSEVPLIYDLTTDGQSAWEMAALADRLRPRFNGVLVLGVSRGTLSLGIKDGGDGYYSSYTVLVSNPRLGFRSDAFDEEVLLAGLDVADRTGIYVLDNVNFLLGRRIAIARNLLRGPPKAGDPLNAPWMEFVNRQEYWHEEIATLPGRIKHYKSNVRANLKVIGRIITSVKQRGDVSIILLEPPINPGWYSESPGAEFVERYHNDLRQFAAEYGVSFLPISEETTFLPTDFADYEGHLVNPAARRRCTETIASWVSEAMME